jgi:predicted nucleic acid-binding protein
VIVVDVNVIAYLLIEGPQTREAEALLARDPEWCAPLLWRSEWRNVLAGYLRRRELDRSGVLECLEASEALVRSREYLPEGARVMELVDASSCSAYDCEYVAVAETLGVPLVTYDRRVIESFPERATAPAEFLGRGNVSSQSRSP